MRVLRSGLYRWLVAYVLRTGGYMSPEDQHELWRARSLLRAHGR